MAQPRYQMLFKVLETSAGVGWYSVFIVNPDNEKDLYMCSQTFQKKSEAQHFADEFNRIANAWGEWA